MSAVPSSPPQSDLADVTVVALEQAVAAPLASMRLADAGARVIKVERPSGDFARRYDRMVRGQSAYFLWLNRGKQSLCLDLNSVEDRTLLNRILAQADVFIQNLKPGALGKFGLNSEALRERHPQLITCDISGFGRAGERSGLKAYDLIVQAEAGLCSITGTEEGPARTGISVCDISAGETAYAAILRALIGRERTGRGRAIRISLFDAIADWMNVPLLQYLYGGHAVRRSGVAHPTIAPYGAFACAGGELIILSIQNEREWGLLCECVLGDSALSRDPRFEDNSARVAHRAELDALVSDRLRRLYVDDACRLLQEAGIAWGRLNSIAEAAAHPHLRFISVATSQGDVEIIAPAAEEAHSTRGRMRVPDLGDHSDLIRREFALKGSGPATPRARSAQVERDDGEIA